MNPERYQRIKQVLMEALDCEPGERAVWLDRACASDIELRAEVESLLAREMQASFLEHRLPLPDSIALEDVDLSGSHIGRIRFDRLLARGGMGEVYAGTDTLLQRPVAVKRMQADLRLSEARRSAFLTEARVLSGLQHPNICQVHDFFEVDDQDFLIMELIEGETLRQILDRGVPDDPIDLAIQAIRGLVAAHERGIAHCDLKPENLMLTPNGTVKVLDFGLASTREFIGTELAPDVDTGSDHSRTRIMGTPGYLAPEQARGERGQTAADLWSFGTVLAELLTGQRIFPPDLDGQSMIARVREGEFSLPAELPRAETALLRSLLQLEPSARPSAREALEALSSIRDRSARRWRWALVAALVGVVVLGTAKYTLDLQVERRVALDAQQRAETARTEAEELAGFMIDELYGGLRAVGRLDLLEPVAFKAADYYGRLEDGAQRGGRGERSLALIRAAEVLDMQGHLPEATQAYGRALDNLIPLAERHPADALIQYRRALAERNLGEVLRFAGNYADGDLHAIRAIELAHELTAGLSPGEGPTEEPTGEQRWSLLLRALYLYADSLVRQGQAERALELLDEAERLALPAVRAAPALQRDLGDIQYKRCMAYYDSKQPDRVVSACQASFAIDRALYDANPDDVRLERNLANAYWMLGRAERLGGQHAEALATTERGLRVAYSMLQRDPDHAEAHNMVAVLKISEAQILQAMGDESGARALYREVLTITEPMIETAMDHATAHNHLIALTELGRLEDAGPLAREIFDSGWRRPEFLEMLAEHELIPISELTDRSSGR